METELLQQILIEIKSIKESQQEMQGDIKSLKEGQQRLETKIDSIKDQVTEFEGKTSAYHLETVDKINRLSKDINAVEIITGKNMTDIAHLKAIK